MNQPPAYCTNCGSALMAVFCTSCGHRSGATTPVAAPATRLPDERLDPALATSTMPQSPVVLPDQAWPVPAAPPAGLGFKALIQGLIAFALVIVLGLGAVFGYGWWRDRAVNQALGSAGKAVDSVLEPLGTARELADVSAAAEKAPKAAATIDKALADLEGETGDLAARSRDVLTDAKALMEAMAPLASLSESSLSVWGSALPEVEVAESSVMTSRRALNAVDSGAADAVPDPGKAIEQAIGVVGGAADGILTAELTGLLAGLDKAGTTSATAAVGERAGPAADAAEAAVTGQSGVEAERLTSLGDALGALAELSAMDPESLHLWESAKSVLTESTSNLEIDAAGTLDSTSAWVSEAQLKMDDWQEAYDLAQDARSHRTSGLDGYVKRVNTVLREYDRARDSIDDDLQAAELDDYSGSYDVEYAMEEGVLTRQDLGDRLMAIVAPPGMGTSHQALISVLDKAVDAMLAGEQAVEDYNACYEACGDSFRDTTAWQAFSAESAGISDAYGAARKSWDAALAAALEAAGALALPPMPVV